MTQPIQAVQICYEHQFGAEREVLPHAVERDGREIPVCDQP